MSHELPLQEVINLSRSVNGSKSLLLLFTQTSLHVQTQVVIPGRPLASRRCVAGSTPPTETNDVSIPEDDLRMATALHAKVTRVSETAPLASGGHRAARAPQLWPIAIESLRYVRDLLSEVIDRVEHHHERVTITRNGHDAAILVSPADLAELEETLSVLSDPGALADIREADAAYSRGDVLRGVEAVRRLVR